MVTRAVILLTVIAVARSASVGEHVTCCGPTEWESLAMASAVYGYETASSMSGRLSVDHKHKLAALSLVRTMNATMNTTMVISVNDSSMYIYFIVEHHRQAEQEQQPQPQCVAYVLKNIISDLSSSCFPAKQSSISDRLKSAAPMNVLAYEYAGLSGLFMVQIAANADDCSPTMFSMSTGASNGPQLNVMLSNVNSGKSDQSGDSLVQMACSNIDPMDIMVPDNGRFGNRRGPMDSMRSSNNADPQQWIADMVTMYIIQMIGTDVSARTKRDLRDMLMAQDKKSQPSATEILKSAMAMKYLMQNVSDFVRPASRNVSVNSSISVDNVLDWMIAQDLIASLMSRKSRDDTRDDDGRMMDDSSIDADDVVSWIAKQKLASRHQEPDLSDIVYAMFKQKLISNLMSGDSNHDASDDHGRDGNDGSDTFNILINQHIISSEDTINSEDNTRDGGNIEAVMAWLIKQKLVPAMVLAGAKSRLDDSGISLPAMAAASAKIHQDDSENSHRSDLMKLMSMKSQPSHGGHRDNGYRDDDSSNIDDLITSMVKKNIMASVMNSKRSKNGPQRHRRDLRDMMNKISQPNRDDGLRNDDIISMDDIISWMMQELMPTMTRNTNDSRKLDLWNVIALMNKRSEWSHGDGDSKNDEGRDDSRDDGRNDDDSISVDDIVAWMIKKEILSSMMPSKGRKDGPQRHKRDLQDVMALMNKQDESNHGPNRDDVSISIDDIITWMIKQEILSSMMPSKGRKDGPQRHKRDLEDVMALMNKQDESNHGPSRDDDSLFDNRDDGSRDDLSRDDDDRKDGGRDDSRDDDGRSDDDSISIDDIIAWMVKQEILSGMMPSKGHKDGTQRHKRDLEDVMALMNKQSRSNHGPSRDDDSLFDGRDDESRDDLSRDDDERSDDSSDMDDLIALMIKQSLMPKNKSH